mgnify:CR=1 FL=1
MREDYRKIQNKMNKFTFGIYSLSVFITLVSMIFFENKGRIGFYLSCVMFWLGYLLVRYLNKKQIAKFFEELEIKEQYKIQYQNEKENDNI